jgi:hypothetical protein
MPTENTPVRIIYTNYKGDTAIRRIIPKSLSFGANEWHGEPQWFVIAYDCDKGAERTFALKDIRAWLGPEVRSC